MFAIFESGGKQYRVEEGDLIEVELLEKGAPLIFDRVLFLQEGSNSYFGAPYLSGSFIEAELSQTVKGPKVLSFKYKKRKNWRKTVGHRQKYSQVKITKIKAQERGNGT